jgi:hypothetical protein
MEKEIRLPSELCDRIFTLEFEIEIGQLSETAISRTIELYVVPQHLYQEAIAFYSSKIAEQDEQDQNQQITIARRMQYYQ